ncbi:pectate lyase-like adhesive domain-containing protein [Listeria cornellensis]|uniref:Uncharacterized protein n=1 Tax=Listeria cornellensis FSL F6-0969 TaxID=1265820 RepID=W7BHU2_9LIST|nr:pectate lyase-like adhesive domain-containing protein [Listeria cornellensis]EUJ24350.1 hypothetical protein PCORN_18711 [Listeria cornellensis FSL F6-0969]
MKNVLRKPITITVMALMVGQTGLASIATYAAEQPMANGTQTIEKRVIVQPIKVATLADFNAALINSGVKDIQLTANISIPLRTIQAKGSKNIDGNGYTLNLNGGNINSEASTVNIVENMIIQNAGAYGAPLGGTATNVTSSYKNITFSTTSKALFNLQKGTVNFSGLILGSNTTATAIEARDINVLDDGMISLTTDKAGIKLYAGTFTIGEAATVDVISRTEHAFENSGGGLVFNFGNLSLIANKKKCLCSKWNGTSIS